MKQYGLVASLFLGLFLFSCGSAEHEENNERNVIQECYYTYNPVNSQLTWTAFKFNEKTPVSGTFNELNVSGAEIVNDPLELIKNLSFSIPIASLNSQNPERDEKIKTSFFGVLTNTNMLTGHVVSIADGTAILMIKLNDIEQELNCTYTLDENSFKLSTTLDLNLFDAIHAVNSLNTICKDLHVGADGVSKLWDVVDITFETTFNADCQ